ncbi:MAG TPA: glycosyltransferase [Chloroflexaceae bacterium]|nr:glycosyltransferase [Chloroflexaceae bacterium]
MELALLAIGSRGDVQPFAALALALRRAGHAARLVGLADYAGLATDYGLPYTAVVGSAAELMDRELVHGALDAAGGALPLGFARRFLAQVEPLVARLCAECLRACAGAGALVASTLGLYPGLFVAERLGLPLVPAHFHPQGATGTMPDVSFAAPPPWAPLAGLYNRATHGLAAHGLWQLLRGPLNRARREAGLAPLGAPALWARVRRPAPLTLYGYSAAVAPPPADWPPGRLVTGYWALEAPAGWAPPPELARFLAAGPPPVYLGFGSVLAGRDPAAVTALLVEALRRAGRRGLIYRGAWGDLAPGALPEGVMAIDATPHDWLFPRVAAVVTHGGAGTVAAALRAGAPVVCVPSYGDQRFWGRRVAALGVGPPPIPRRELEAGRLAAAIGAACADGAMREQAAAIGAALWAEDGAARAAEALDAALAARPAGGRAPHLAEGRP